MTMTFLNFEEQKELQRLKEEYARTNKLPKHWDRADSFWYGFLMGLQCATDRAYKSIDNTSESQ